MERKYEPLTTALRAAADRGEPTVDMDFAEVGELVLGLPRSASSSRQWWANGSNSQALAWRAAGFHVSAVSLDRRRVRFSTGVVGGARADRAQASTGTARRPVAKSSTRVGGVSPTPVGDPVDVRVIVRWLDAGTVSLDTSGKPAFVSLPSVPGLYRFTLTGGRGQVRPRVYIGESQNLAHRLAGNYRNPGSGQQTSLRINARLREHLGQQGTVTLVVATSAEVYVNSEDSNSTASANLDLSRKASRLLAENAALVLAQLTDDADIENLP